MNTHPREFPGFAGIAILVVVLDGGARFGEAVE